MMEAEFNLLSWGEGPKAEVSRTLMGTMKIVADKIVFDFKDNGDLETISSAPQDIIDGPALRYFDFVICKFFHSTRIEVIEKEED
jgi:hypothetical protein